MNRKRHLREAVVNILIIPSWYPSTKNPISGSFFREQAMALADFGHNVTILNTTLQPRNNYFSKENYKMLKYTDEKLHVYSYAIPSFGTQRVGTLFYEIFKRNMYKTFQQMQNDGLHFDIIHAHSILPAGISACELGRKNNIPVVVTEHSSAVLQNNMDEREIIFIRRTVKEADRIICVSPALRSSVLELTKTEKEVLVIPNNVSPLFSYNVTSPRKEKFTFVSVANLNDGKRSELTIRAFHDVFRNEPNIKLSLIGDGPLMKRIRELITDLKMEKQIQLYGRLSREQTAEVVKKSDAFVLASAYETFGIVYIEAMACGKPVIGTRNGGAEFIVNPSNGILVDVDNVEQLSQAMKYLYENIDNFDNQKISTDCLTNYSGETIARELNDVYMSILGR